MDFLKVDPNDEMYSKVEYILLDPSCSGSGVVGRLDHLIDDDEEQEDTSERLESLSNFQKSAILHAFKFPMVKKVVYSTCSVHQQENEDVVKFILGIQNQFILAKNVFNSWERRGLDVFEQGLILLFLIF